jgi:hypothetical protein
LPFVLHAQIRNAVACCNSFLKFLTTRSESESARNYNNNKARGSYKTGTSKKIQAGRDSNPRRKSKWKIFLTAQVKQSRFSEIKITRKNFQLSKALQNIRRIHHYGGTHLFEDSGPESPRLALGATSVGYSHSLAHCRRPPTCSKEPAGVVVFVFVDAASSSHHSDQTQHWL